MNENKTRAVTARYMRLGQFMDGMDSVLYVPEKPKRCGVVILHSDSNYLTFPGGENLAARGFPTLCANVSRPDAPLEKKLSDVKRAVEAIKARPGVEKVVLLGHSGGATLMSCYQAVAENGPGIFRDEHRIVKMGPVEDLPAADGLMLIDSNFGNGVMTLVSIDPAVTDETSGVKTDPALSAYTPESGFVKDGDTRYTEPFKTRFYAAQAARQERLIARALERYEALEAGRGGFCGRRALHRARRQPDRPQQPAVPPGPAPAGPHEKGL